MPDITVLGAGIVGISTALALQARGHSVVVVDAKAPGLETSFGNSGLIQGGGGEPFTMPRDASTLASYISGKNNAFQYELRELLLSARRLLQYYRASSPARLQCTAAIYSALIARAIGDHLPIVDAAQARHLVRMTGFYRLARDAQALDALASAADRLTRMRGVESQVLGSAALRAQEPALTEDVGGAVWFPGALSVLDPARLVTAYASLLKSRGADIAIGDAKTLSQGKAGWTVRTQGGLVSSAHVVVALGPWAPDLLARFGYRVAMLWQRGYHGNFQVPRALTRPLVDAVSGVMLSPMSAGLRITTAAAIVNRKSPPDRRQLDVGLQSMRQVMEIGAQLEGDGCWFGHRPCMADMLPVVGQAPRHRGLWVNIGHGHHGLTLGPTTAELLADALDAHGEPAVGALSPSGRM